MSVSKRSAAAKLGWKRRRKRLALEHRIELQAARMRAAELRCEGYDAHAIGAMVLVCDESVVPDTFAIRRP